MSLAAKSPDTCGGSAITLSRVVPTPLRYPRWQHVVPQYFLQVYANALNYRFLDHGSGQPNSGGQTVKTTSGVNNKLWTTPAAVVLPS